MSHFSLELLTGSLFCLAHLGIGILLGARMGRADAASRAPRAEPAVAPQQVIDWNEIQSRLAELSDSIQSLQAMTPPELCDKKSELISYVNHLHSAIGDRERPFKSDSSNSQAQCAVEPPIEGVLTNEQILLLLSGATFERPPPSVHVPRHKFPVTQVIATGDSDGVLRKISHVQCHDLSVNDVRFLIDDPPTVERVVIGLGVPKPVKWLAGTVEEFHSVFMYGRVGYLVTVRFISNFEHRLAL